MSFLNRESLDVRSHGSWLAIDPYPDDRAPADSGRGRSGVLLAGVPTLAELVPSSRGHLLGHCRRSSFGTGLRQQNRLGCDADIGPCHLGDLFRTCSGDTKANMEASEEAV